MAIKLQSDEEDRAERAERTGLFAFFVGLLLLGVVGANWHSSGGGDTFRTSSAESTPPPPYAFATFFSAFNQSEHPSFAEDHYLEGVRMMNYQLRHNPATRGHPDLPLLVLIEEDVAEAKQQTLRDEDATVIPGQHLTPDWVRNFLTVPRWGNVLMKLNLFEMTQYEKICFIDADTYIDAPIEGIFQDPATDIVPVGQNTTERLAGGAFPPSEYMFAAMLDRGIYQHKIPPLDKDWYYLNAGFCCFKPSNDMFDYYTSILNTKDSYVPIFPEQGLFNEVHNEARGMPWTHLNWQWSTNFATKDDLEAGSKTFHGKLWETDEEEMRAHHSKPLHEKWWATAKEMYAFYEGRSHPIVKRSE